MKFNQVAPKKKMEKLPASDHVIQFMDEQDHTKSIDDANNMAETKLTQNPSKFQTIRPLTFSKPKARVFEFNSSVPISLKPSCEKGEDSDDEYDQEHGKDDQEGICGIKEECKKKRRKIPFRLLFEWLLLLLTTSCLICALTISPLRNNPLWGLHLWKWCLLILIIFSGRLISSLVIRFLVFLIERNFMLREKLLYFVYGLRKSFQNCVWLGFVLLSLNFMFNSKLNKQNKMLTKLREALLALLIAATIWPVKIILVKVLASSFFVATYFDRMKESVFHHYVLDALSGPPVDVKERHNLKELRKFSKLKKLSMQSKSSAWSVKRLANYVRFFGLSTISKSVDEFGNTATEITSEMEARNCSRKIFKNVANQGAKYIEKEDLMRFLNGVEINTIFPLFEGAVETGRITKSAFRNWVVRAYYERKYLAHSLDDTKTAVQQLHKLASGIVIFVILVISLLVMGLLSTQILALLLSQLVLLGFAFQNTCKTIFESIIFVFVVHPFDIGDRCVIDGVQMIVEEMNILTTVFLRYDNEKIYYPNAVLITKPISNFYRSPEMCDAISFDIDTNTSMDTIIALKKAIQLYLESKPKYWNPKHSVIVKGIGNVHTMGMMLCVQHTINHQNYGDRSNRITELIFELKKIFETLNIKYSLLPQQVQVDMTNLRS
ncbi:mechanosensitive ion channel protein 10-like [Lycium ferocissimum]|uniref:mechanosensitive ion channel protein 10-like n=1 Tax=Lycium ferocissimum TaxID=112874 RepID=UPI0028158B0D|nr:mechanosensitive ion channel protein 10-like [Lycium ferocissimum]